MKKNKSLHIFIPLLYLTLFLKFTNVYSCDEICMKKKIVSQIPITILLLDEENGEVVLILDQESQKNLLVSGSEDVVLASFSLGSKSGSSIIDGMSFELDGKTNALLDEKIKILAENEELTTVSFMSGKTQDITDLNLSLGEGKTVDFSINGTMSSIGSESEIMNGDPLSIILTSISPKRKETKVSGVNNGNDNPGGVEVVQFATLTAFDTYPIVQQVSFPTENDSLTSGLNKVAIMFTMEAQGAGDFHMGGLKISTIKTGTFSIDNFKVEGFRNSALTQTVNINGGTFEGRLVGDKYFISFQDLTNEQFLRIQKNRTYYFRVVVDLSGVTFGDELTISIEKDGFFGTAIGGGSGIPNSEVISSIEGGSNFSWSANFSTSQPTEWVNGNAVQNAEMTYTRKN